MNLPEQIAVLAAALAEGYIGWEDAYRWAEAWLAVEPTPSAIMDLFVTPPPPHRADWVMRLREKSPLPLSVDRQIQLLVVARQSGRLSDLDFEPKLFLFVMEEPALGARGEQLWAALVDWDVSYDEDPVPPLSVEVEELLAEYLADAGDMVALLPWLWGGVRGERKADAGSPSARAG